MAIASPLNLQQITTGIRSLGVAVTRAQVSANRSAGILVNRNKIKRKLVFGDRLSFDRRRERVRRRRQEDIIESSTIGGFIKNRGLALANSTRGFLGRIMDFLGTLLVGWLLNNLPTIISMAQELMARMGRLVNILGGFVNNIGKSLQSFGGVLGAVAQNVINFDFLDSNQRVQTAMDDLNSVFDDMSTQIDDGLKLFTTPLGEGLVSGEDAAPTGTDYTTQPTAPSQAGSPSGGTSGGGTKYPQLAQMVVKGEGGVNSVNRGNANDTPGGAKSIFGKNLTEMTVGEIMQAQRKNKVFAVGKYQFIPETLSGAVSYTKISLNARFDSATQNRLFDYLIDVKRPEIGAYINGKSNDRRTAIQQLAREFASVGLEYPEAGRRRGQSRYAGTGGNRASISPETAAASLDGQRKGGAETIQAQATPRPTQITPRPAQPSTKIVKVPPGNINPTIGDRLGAGRGHKGVDLQVENGTPLRAISDGIIVDSDYEKGWGNFLVMKDNRGVYHLYGHMQSGYKKRGPVKKGEVIGKVGMTGRTSGPHLHWETGTGWNGGVITGRFDALSMYSKYAPFNTSPTSEDLGQPTTISTPAPAQIATQPTQRRQQLSSQVTPQRVGQQIVIIDDVQPPQIPSAPPSGGGSMGFIPIQTNSLNSYITKKLLLDLAYT